MMAAYSRRRPSKVEIEIRDTETAVDPGELLDLVQPVAGQEALLE